MNIKCIVSYDGTNFYGFQRQKNRRSVQAVLEEALRKMTKEKIQIVASGRTDRGVHARGQVICFESNLNVPEIGWKKGLNSLLDSDVHIDTVEFVDNGFHPRYSAIKKEYRYYIKTGEYDPLINNYVGYYETLDIGKIEEALPYFIGTHDYKGFSSNNEIEDTKRTIFKAEISFQNGLYELIFIGNGFMRYMVRRMVGTLVEIGMGRYEGKQIALVLSDPDHYFSGRTAPANGLFLYKVYYEGENNDTKI